MSSPLALPATWQMSRVDHEATVNARIGWKALTASEYVDEGIYFLNTPNIKGRDIDFRNTNFITQFRYDESPELKLRVGDVLIAKDGNTLGITQVVTALPGPSTVNGSIAVIRPAKMDVRFFRYVLASDWIQGEIGAVKAGMGVPHLFQADLRKFRIPKPTLAIQQVIADSLDRETERIDVLVDAKRRLIDLLAEKRTALITHAVTKGLDPTVPMKDSGIPWIGSMPAHWSIRKLGHIGRVLGGTGFPDRYQGELAGDFPFYKVSDMTIKGNLSILSRAANYVSSDVVQDLGGTLIPRNAIVFPKVGAALLTNKRRLTDDLSLIDNNCMAVTFESGTPQYWVHLLGVLDFAWIVQPGPVPSISGSQVKDLLIPVPPTDEQQAISCSINAVAETALAASRILTSQLDLLAEYRQAVITAAVTGQLDEATLKRRKPVDEALGVEVPS